MRIGIDLSYASQEQVRGIGVYCKNLVASLLSLYPEHEFYLFSNRSSQLLNGLEQYKNVHIRVINSNYPLYEQFLLPMRAKKECLDVFHWTGNTKSIFLKSARVEILTVHDLIFYEKSIFQLFLKKDLGSVYRAIVFNRLNFKEFSRIFVSNYSLRSFVSRFNCIDDNIAIHSGPGEGKNQNKILEPSAYISSAVISQKYIFAFGSTAERKNTAALIKSYLAINIENKPSLIIVGINNIPLLTQKNNLCDEADLESKGVHLFGYVSESDVSFLYTHCMFFVFPSLSEGFGLPVLEAQFYKKPVIASNVTSIPELIGPGSEMFNPKKNDELTDCIAEFINKFEKCNYSAPSDLDSWLQKFTWENCAIKTFKFYEDTTRISTRGT